MPVWQILTVILLLFRATQNIYDTNWLTRGNVMIAPGVERVDTVRTDNGYEMKSIWCRNDLSDTSMMKLSATGYIYGLYRIWRVVCGKYIILDFGTRGETVFTMDVSDKYGYNNMAIGCMQGIAVMHFTARPVISGASAPAGSVCISPGNALSESRS